MSTDGVKKDINEYRIETPTEPVVTPPIVPTVEATDGAPAAIHLAEPACPKEISVKIAKEKALTRFELLSILLSAVTFLITVATFIVFYLQLQESKRQTDLFREQATQAARDAHTAQSQTQHQIDLSKDSFRRDQQPYLWLTGIPKLENYQNPITKEFQVIVSANYKNFGKSPAIALQRYNSVEVGPDALSRFHSGSLGQAKTITPPVDEFNFAAITPPMKTLPEMSQDFEVVLFSRFQFLDLLGHRYETDVCMAHLQTGAWMYCKSHNEIKDCEVAPCEP